MLKEINKEMSLEAVEKLMDDTADAIAYQEVSQRFPAVLITRKYRIYWLQRLQMRRRKRYWKNWSNCVVKHWDYQRCLYIHYHKKIQELKRIRIKWRSRSRRKKDKLY